MKKYIFPILTIFILIFLLILNSLNTYAAVSYGWARVAGGAGRDFANSVETDSLGNIYVTGKFEGTNVNFNQGGTADLKSSNGGGDIFITKINSDNSYGWTKEIGGTSEDQASTVTVDSSDNVYFTGYFSGTVNFNPGGVADNKTATGTYPDVYITKINSDGSYAWTKAIGDDVTDVNYLFSYDLATDSDDSVYLTGGFRETDVDFDPSAGVDLKSTTGGGFARGDVFVTKLLSDGTYGWTKTFGGNVNFWDDIGYGLTADSDNNIYVTGVFTGSNVDFDPGAGTDLHSTNGENDVFISKFSSDGTFIWVKTIGSIYTDYIDDIDIDSNSNIYMAGSFQEGSVDFDPGAGTDLHSSNGGLDIFLLKLSSDGNFGWVKTMGGASDDDFGYGIAVDQYDNTYITGSFNGSNVDFDPGAGTDLHTAISYPDIYFSKFSSSGNYFYTYTVGGGGAAGYNEAYDIAVDTLQGVFVAGEFTDDDGSGHDFNPLSGIDTKYNATSDGNEDIFLLKLEGAYDAPTAAPTASPTPAVTLSPAQGGGSNCTDLAPVTAPNLFSAVRIGNNVELAFAPIIGQNISYMLLYGYFYGDERFGATININYSTAAIKYLIHSLAIDKSYTFWLRALNGCAAGPNSNPITISAVGGSSSQNNTPTPTPQPGSSENNPEEEVVEQIEPTNYSYATPMGQVGNQQENNNENIPQVSGVSTSLGEITNNLTLAGVITLASIATTIVVSNVLISSISLSSELIKIYATSGRSVFFFPHDLAFGFWQNLSYMAISYFTVLTGIIIKKRKYSGMVFNSITKFPVSGAFVIFYSKSGNLKTAVTDKKGFYSVMLLPDIYELRVRKNKFSFPSKVVTTAKSVEFNHIYTIGEKIEITKGTEKISNIAIPIDPVSYTNNFSQSITRITDFTSSVLDNISYPLVILSLVITGYATFSNPTMFNKVAYFATYFFLFGNTIRVVRNKFSTK